MNATPLRYLWVWYAPSSLRFWFILYTRFQGDNGTPQAPQIPTFSKPASDTTFRPEFLHQEFIKEVTERPEDAFELVLGTGETNATDNYSEVPHSHDPSSLDMTGSQDDLYFRWTAIALNRTLQRQEDGHMRIYSVVLTTPQEVR